MPNVINLNVDQLWQIPSTPCLQTHVPFYIFETKILSKNFSISIAKGDQN